MNKENEEKKPEAVIPSIRYLRIERFRGIEGLEWRPAAGLNVVVGPGDTGKSTILEAIALLFSPAPNFGLTEFDYFKRDFSKGFVIEAVLAVGDAKILQGDKFPLPPLQGWQDGKLVDLPDENGAEAVLVCRLTGTPDFETLYEVIAADGETKTAFARPLRQKIGVMRLGVGERGERDLRLVQGGALDRFMQGHDLRQSILQAILKTPIHDQLGEKPKAALGQIEKRFTEKNLPHPIRLGLVGTPGVSLAASVGLTVGATDESALPLPSWGTGTRRFASLELASILAESSTLAVVDEPEAGLEPYRQRSFIRELYSEGKRQAFITTHAPAVLSAASGLEAVTWRINFTGGASGTNAEAAGGSSDGAKPAPEAVEVKPSHQLASLEPKKAQKFLKAHPEAVLARLPVICEGITEVGFATRLFIERFTADFSARGIFAVDAVGHDTALSICKAFIGAGIPIAAVVDDEGHSSGGWDFVKQHGNLLRWTDGAILEKAIISALPDSELPNVPAWAEESGREIRHLMPELRAALGTEDKGKTPEQLLTDFGRERFVDALLQVVCPPRTGNKKPTGWFKSFSGGFLLAEKVLALKPHPIYDQASTFLDSVEAKTQS